MTNALNLPIQTNQRIIIVDVLRGWALLGVVLMNHLDFFTLVINLETFKPNMLTSVLMHIPNIFFSAKLWIMLGLLFGYGFAVLMNNVREKGHNPYSFYALQVYASKWWLIKYYYGPIEWVWRQLSYRKRLALKKQINQL